MLKVKNENNSVSEEYEESLYEGFAEEEKEVHYHEGVLELCC